MLIAAGTAAFHIHSYWWSEELTLCDVTLAVDEGLVSLNVPLVRLAAKESPRSRFLIFKRGPGGWEAAGDAKMPSRAIFVVPGLIGVDGENGFLFADFGYWKGDWQSASRPGPFVIVFIPVWLIGCVMFGIYLAFTFRWVRFRLLTLLAVMTLIASLLWLLTQRAGS